MSHFRLLGSAVWAALVFGWVAINIAAESATHDKSAHDAISVPLGFSVELVAAAPLVERPMMAAFDDRGRLYVADSAGVNLRGPELSKNPPHVIRRLEDTDGDGKFDRSIVFADKLVFPQGIVWHDGAVYCSSPPSFWRLEDTDNDGTADKREELVTGFANTGVADDMHGGSLGPDGRLYWCAGRFPHEIRRPGGPVVHKGTAPLILRCRPDGSELEVVCGSQGNAVGVAFTREGDMFASGTFLAPNSMGAGLRDALVHCVDGAEYPVRDRTLHEHKRTGEVLPPLTHLGVSASSDLTICRGDALGKDCEGNLFSALFNMHKVMLHKIERNGATFTCRNEDFLVSTDADFHPTDVFQDADGSLLVIDTGGWFRIGCPTSQLAKPEVLGGIYRVRKTGSPMANDPRGLKIAWTSLSPAETARLLNDARFEVRDRAIAQLAKMGTAALPSITSVLASNAATETRCAAVWALSRIDGAEARAASRAALDDSDASVRQAAARVAGLNRDVAAEKSLSRLVSSDPPSVRREAATAIGRIGASSSVPALLEALNATGDRFLEHAVIFALIRIGDRAATCKGLELAGVGAKRGALIALDQMDNGQLTPEMVTPFLAPTNPLMQQTALWVIAHHGEWAPAMVSFFRQWIARNDMDDVRRDELRRQLLAFVQDSAVQELIAAALADERTLTSTRLLLLEVIGQAPVAKLPASWRGPLKQSLEDENEPIVRQAVATLRALPLDKRPLLARVDKQINFPAVENRFAGTQLSQSFCVRWQGVVRIPQEGTYSFFTDSDDGSQLFIDGQLIVDNSGSHGMRERSGQLALPAGDHELRVEFIQGEGEAGCKVLWTVPGRDKEILPPSVLFHRPRSTVSPTSANLEPGLAAEFYELGGPQETFPDLAASEFDSLLVHVALDSARPTDVRVQSAAAVAPRLQNVDSVLFDFLLTSLAEKNPPLVRLDAAEALGKLRLDEAQLKTLCGAVATAGVLEIPKLVHAFERPGSTEVGDRLVVALGHSPGLKSLHADTLSMVLSSYPDATRQKAKPLFDLLTVDASKKKARLAELQDVLSGGEIQRGRDLFFGNKKAICATCHAVQGQGGTIGPDLSKIGAIRASHDMLEAIIFPSASFARGYESFTIQTDDGRVITGIISRETADAIYTVNTDRVETRIPRSAIESLQQSAVSIMPEGMDNQLSRQELADLIAFLQSLR